MACHAVVGRYVRACNPFNDCSDALEDDPGVRIKLGLEGGSDGEDGEEEEDEAAKKLKQKLAVSFAAVVVWR